MKVQYFEDTDTLYIEFQSQQIAQTRDLDENTLLVWTPTAMSARSLLSTQANAQISAICKSKALRPDKNTEPDLQEIPAYAGIQIRIGLRPSGICNAQTLTVRFQ